MAEFNMARRSPFLDYGLPRGWDTGKIRNSSENYNRLITRLMGNKRGDLRERVDRFVSERFLPRIAQRATSESPRKFNITDLADEGVTGYRIISEPVTEDGYRWLTGVEFDISRLKNYIDFMWGQKIIGTSDFSKIGNIAILFPDYDETSPVQTVQRQPEDQTKVISKKDWKRELGQIGMENQFPWTIDRPVSFYSKMDDKKDRGTYFVGKVCDVLIDALKERLKIN